MSQKIKKYAIRFCVVVTVFIAVSILIAAIMPSAYESSETTDSETPTGFTYTRESYVSGCSSGGMSDPENTLTKEYYDTYCGCVYDKGVAVHGAEKFTQINIKAEQTNDVTELNNIINQCVAINSNS